MVAAISTPASSYASDADHRPREKRERRVPIAHITHLRDIARGVEEGEAGLRSIAVADRDHAAGLLVRDDAESSSLYDDDDADRLTREKIGRMMDAGLSDQEIERRLRLEERSDGSARPLRMFAAERWCDGAEIAWNDETRRWETSKRHADRQRCRRAIHALHRCSDAGTLIGTLHVVYGWPDPIIRSLPAGALDVWDADPLHPLAGLARYTDAVEAVRKDLVESLAESVERPEYVSVDDRPRRHRGVCDVCNCRHSFSRSSALLRCLGEINDAHRLAVTHLGKAPKAMTKAERADLYQLAHAESAKQWADRHVTSGDALRFALQPPRGRADGETKDDYATRIERARWARDGFIRSVRADANRMLEDATEAYYDAWLAS